MKRKQVKRQSLARTVTGCRQRNKGPLDDRPLLFEDRQQTMCISIGFVFDPTVDTGVLQSLNIVDNASHETIAIKVRNGTVSTIRVARRPDHLTRRRGLVIPARSAVCFSANLLEISR